MSDSVFCPSCDTVNEAGSAACKKCRLPLPRINRGPTSTVHDVPVAKKRGFGWVTLLFIVLGFFPVLPLEPWWLIGCWMLAFFSFKNGWGK